MSHTLLLVIMLFALNGIHTDARSERTLSNSHFSIRSEQRIDVTGKWKLNYIPKRGRPGRVDLKLTQNGTKILVSSYAYVGGSSGGWYDEPNGRIQGNRIILYFEEKGETATYTGSVRGNTMKGVMSFGGTWVARRLGE